jgi:hypothetical protein
MSEGNGKIVKIASAAAVIVGLFVGVFELKEYIAWAEDLRRLEEDVSKDFEDVRLLIAQTYEQMQRDACTQHLNSLRLEEYKWMMLQQQHPNDPHIRATLERIRADIAREERKLRGE